MSEYQYYEFQALDRILTKTEQSYIESLSSRVELSPTKAAFTYSYGDFRGNPQDLLEKCFDVMLYMANWGTRQLLFRLSDSLQSFVEFFKVDNDLITVAATASNSTQAEFTSLEALIPSLPEAERNEFLVKVLKNEPLIGVQLAKRLKEFSNSQLTLVQGNSNGRLLFQLIASAKDCSKLRQQKELKAAKEARIRELLALVPKEAKLWEEVFRLIAFKQSKSYDDAIAHLRNLRDLAEHQGKLEQFKLRVQEMQTDYSNRPGLLSRLQKAGLLRL